MDLITSTLQIAKYLPHLMSNITLFVIVGSDFYPNHDWDRFNVNVYGGV